MGALRKLRSAKGAILIEMVMVMLLLSVFGVTIYTLICSGADTQSRIMREKDSQADARVALSYINVRLRQSDSAGKIEIEPIELTGRNAILIHEVTFEYDYDTWIYEKDGILYECLVDTGEQPYEDFSFEIVEVERIDIERSGGGVTSTIYYDYGGETNCISSTIRLRSN